MSGSICAYSVSLSTFFRSLVMPCVLGVRVILNTIGVCFIGFLVIRCRYLFFDLFIAFVRSTVRSLWMKCCCKSSGLCPLLHS